MFLNSSFCRSFVNQEELSSEEEDLGPSDSVDCPKKRRRRSQIRSLCTEDTALKAAFIDRSNEYLLFPKLLCILYLAIRTADQPILASDILR